MKIRVRDKKLETHKVHRKMRNNRRSLRIMKHIATGLLLLNLVQAAFILHMFDII